MPDGGRATVTRRPGFQVTLSLAACAALVSIPLWVGIAVNLIRSDTQLPRVRQVVHGTRVTVPFRGSAAGGADNSLYVTPRPTGDDAFCTVLDLPTHPSPLERSQPAGPSTATRTVEGTTYWYYGRTDVFSRDLECSGGTQGLLLTADDHDHSARNSGFAFLAFAAVVGLFSWRVLRGPRRRAGPRPEGSGRQSAPGPGSFVAHAESAGEQRMAGTAGRLLVDGRDVAPARVADTYWTRLRGLLGTRGLDGGLLITRANSVHGLGMVYALDVALLDDDLQVLHVLRLRPFGLTRARRGVKHVLEAECGAFERWRLTPGSRLEVAG